MENGQTALAGMSHSLSKHRQGACGAGFRAVARGAYIAYIYEK